MDRSFLDRLETGVTTRTEVEAALGEPTQAIPAGDDKVMLQYIYSRSRTKPTSFIPVVGLFSAGSNAEAQHVTILIDEDGIVEDYEWRETTKEIRTRRIGGPPSPM